MLGGLLGKRGAGKDSGAVAARAEAVEQQAPLGLADSAAQQQAAGKPAAGQEGTGTAAVQAATGEEGAAVVNEELVKPVGSSSSISPMTGMAIVCVASVGALAAARGCKRKDLKKN